MKERRQTRSQGPRVASLVTGRFRRHPDGFGFVVPAPGERKGGPGDDEDVYVSSGDTSGAMDGDRVVVKVSSGRRGPRKGRAGRIDQILERALGRVVGVLSRSGPTWFVRPQGRAGMDPVLVRDVKPADREGVKVVVEIVEFPTGTEPATGVIVENLGAPGPVDVETLAITREFDLRDVFPEAVLDEARAQVRDADMSPGDREDLRDRTIITIDPADARDFDDAIEVVRKGEGWTLGVHIADVVAFVPEGSALDQEARVRGNSVYFPRKVLPMLPEVLSNGLCSLQEGQDRFARSVYVDYDARGRILGTRFHNSVIRSSGRLEYVQAQAMIDGKADAPSPGIGALLGEMAHLARVIEARRNEAGMLHLELPEVVLDLDDTGRVRDAHPADDSHTHTIIEMFMVEANEAVARLLDRQGVPFPRRIHPEGGEDVAQRLVQLLRTVGLSPGGPLDRKALQGILDRVRGRPAERAVNLAVLKTLSRASYATTREGHFALASDHYCHFTSPIRRYPDLIVHRLLDAWIRGTLDPSLVDQKAMDALCDNCTETERRAEDAENKLRDLLVLQLLAGRVGEPFVGVVTGVARAGAFVRSAQFGIEGMIRLDSLPGDWWEADPRAGIITGTGTGATLRLGDPVACRIARVDLEARRLDLILQEGGRPGKARDRKKRVSRDSQRTRTPAPTRTRTRQRQGPKKSR